MTTLLEIVVAVVPARMKPSNNPGSMKLGLVAQSDTTPNMMTDVIK
jgi:hypothetical protein